MKQIGSQNRETLEEAGYKIHSQMPNQAILENGDGKLELFMLRDDHAGWVVEINGKGYEFIRSASEKDLIPFKQYEKWQKLQNRVLQWFDKHNHHADFYHGVAELGYVDQTMIAANWNPPAMKRMCDWLEENFGEVITIDWSDEWMGCECGKAVRSSPDSYGWEPSYVWLSDCEICCHECTNSSLGEIIEHYKNQTDKALPRWFSKYLNPEAHTIEDEEGNPYKFKCLETEEAYCARFETGFHHGQNDTPEKAIALAKEILPYKFDYLFVITSRGQFDINWTIMINKKV